MRYWGPGLVVMMVCLSVHALVETDHPNPETLEGQVKEAIGLAQSQFRQTIAAARGTAAGAAYGELAMVYQAHEFYQAASQAYANAAEAAPTDSRWPYFQGTLAHADGRFDFALDRFSRSVDLNPDYLAASIRLARAQLDAGRQSEAQSLLTELARRYPDQAVIWADRGQIELNQGHFDQAAKFLQQALKLQPLANRLHYPMAMALRGAGAVEDATDHLRQQGPRDVEFADPLFQRMRALSSSFSYYMSMGLQAARSGEYVVARDLLQKAIQTNPQDGLARVNHARMLAATGEVEAGKKALEEWLKSDPQNSTGWLELGIMEEMLNQDPAAAGYYETAVSVDVQNFRALLLAGNARMRLAQYSQAALHYKAAIGLRPERTELLLSMAMAQQAAGQCHDAIDSLYELVSKLPEDIEVLMAYSRVAATCSGVDRRHATNGLNAARNIYAMAPRLSAIITLAMIEAATGDFQAAIDYQSQAIFMALRDGHSEQQAELAANLERYRTGKPALVPWPDSHPMLHPRSMTAADRN